MNYLGHLALSYTDPTLMVGNLIADGLRPADRLLLPRMYDRGISLHYAIDGFVDRHEAFVSTLKIFRPVHRKYSPVVVDIVYDYYLASQWKVHIDVPYDYFTGQVYRILSEHLDNLRGKARLQVDQLLKHRYLDVYTSLDGLARVLTRMDERARFESNFTEAVKIVIMHHEELSGSFELLWLDTSTFVKDWLESVD